MKASGISARLAPSAISNAVWAAGQAESAGHSRQPTKLSRASDMKIIDLLWSSSEHRQNNSQPAYLGPHRPQFNRSAESKRMVDVAKVAGCGGARVYSTGNDSPAHRT